MPNGQWLTPELCAREFRDLKEDVGKLAESLDLLTRKLTVSNGGPCVIEQVHKTADELKEFKCSTNKTFESLAERKMIAKKWALGILSAIILQTVIAAAIYVKQSNVLATLILGNHELLQQKANRTVP